MKVFQLMDKQPHELTVDECKAILKAVRPLIAKKATGVISGDRFASLIKGKGYASKYIRKLAEERLMDYNVDKDLYSIAQTIGA